MISVRERLILVAVNQYDKRGKQQHIQLVQTSSVISCKYSTCIGAFAGIIYAFSSFGPAVMVIFKPFVLVAGFFSCRKRVYSCGSCTTHNFCPHLYEFNIWTTPRIMLLHNKTSALSVLKDRSKNKN